MAYLTDVVTLTAILIIAVHGYMLIKGLGGLLHLGHAVFYGLGAYAAAIVSLRLLPPGCFPLSVLAGGVAAMAGAVVIGWPALRDRGRYFMIVTFAVQLIFVTLAINLQITGGPDGLSSVPGLSFGPWQPVRGQPVTLGPLVVSYAGVKLAVMAGFAALSFAVCRRLIASPFGRLVRAVREDEIAAEACGRDANRTKLAILTLGAGLTGLAGALFAHHFNYVGPTQFELDATVLFLVMLIIGGQYSLTGATLGVVLMMATLEGLRFLLENVIPVPFETTAHLRQVLFGLTLIIVLSWRGQGLLPERLPRHRRRPVLPARVEPVPLRHKAGGAPAATPVLTCHDLHKSFGGVVAVDKVGLELTEGLIIAIIGPNGAGKTSTFNLLSGVEPSEGGEIRLRGVPIGGRPMAEIARLGVARTFQDVRVWRRLTAIENILAARPDQPGTNPLRWFLEPGRTGRAEQAGVVAAWRLLERFGLEDHADTPAGQLSYAQRKMLSLARITAFAPAVMLLDEPTSGVDPRRLDTFLAHIRSFASEDRRAVCLIEHNMTVVRDLADRVLFMEAGRIIAAGRPAEILGDPHLMRTYLGAPERKRA